jgi:hypothetical protein
MIATIVFNGELHVVQWTGRVRLHAEVRTYCTITADASEGVYQLPDAAITKGTGATLRGTKWPPCSRCRALIAL